ncbi:MAG: glycosyltransferase [Bryobacteraceae bacterium]|jgi:dolichol-phosphate mannosyltransferase
MRKASKSTQTRTGNQPQPNGDVLISVLAIVPDDGEAMESFVASTLEILDKHYAYYELLLIDNGSPLDVYCRLQELQGRLPNVRVVRLSRRYSTEVSLAAALDHSIGDYVVLIEPALHPPEVIPQLVSAAMDGCDSVTAMPAGQRDSLLDRLFCHPAYRLASILLGFELRPNESTFKVFSRRLVNSIVRIRSKNRYLSYLHASVGLRQSAISYEGAKRGGKRSAVGHTIGRLNAVANILVANTAIPLRFASMLGLLASAGNLAYLAYIFVVTLVKSRIAEGWLTISITNTTMFLLLFTILTILSGYVARILDETKEQPLYFVESETNSTVSRSIARPNVVYEQVEQPFESDRLSA